MQHSAGKLHFQLTGTRPNLHCSGARIWHFPALFHGANCYVHGSYSWNPFLTENSFTASRKWLMANRKLTASPLRFCGCCFWMHHSAGKLHFGLTATWPNLRYSRVRIWHFPALFRDQLGANRRLATRSPKSLGFLGGFISRLGY